MDRKLWVMLFLALVLVVFLSSCTTPGITEQSKAPAGSSEVGRFTTHGEHEVTVWTWCNRDTKVYLAVMPYKGTSITTSPNHKDCQ